MRAIKGNLWIAAVAFGIAFLVLGGFFVVKGLDAKSTIRAALAEEQVTTSSDAEQFGVAGGVPVLDAKTAEAQAKVIRMHSIDRYGRYTEMGRDDPNRATYLSGLTLRNSLSLAVLGFGVADLAVGAGAVILLLGISTLAVGAPALYWLREPAPETARMRVGQPAGVEAD